MESSTPDFDLDVRHRHAEQRRPNECVSHFCSKQVRQISPVL
jgi:hypothetical protein